MPGAQALRPHTAIHSITPAPSGSADFQPASAIRPAWVRRRLVRMLGARASRPHTAMRHLGTRASSPHTAIHHLGARASRPHTATHHLGARASRPHAGYAGFQPAYRDTPPGCAGFQPAYDAPPRSTGVQPAYSDTPPGSAGVSPACWVHRLPARLRRPTSEHGCPARIPRQWQWVLDQSLTS